MNNGRHPFSIESLDSDGTNTGARLRSNSSSSAENPNRPLFSEHHDDKYNSPNNSNENVIIINFKGAVIGSISIILTILGCAIYIINELKTNSIEIVKATEDVETLNKDIDDLQKEYKDLQGELHSVDKNQAVMKEKLDHKNK